ncbi:MAG: tRNA dihydrouridine synthase DusB [Deltaproteobacteria bacterium]
MLKIGNLKLENNLILAPMAGITNLPFRLMCKEEGAGLVFSEMVSAMAIVRNSQKTSALLRTDEKERPLAVQLFGSEPKILAEAARIVEGVGADIIDINMGCPAKKVVSTGAGSSLLKDPFKIKEIIEAVRSAAKVPFTVKIRSGWDVKSINYLEIGRIAEECGADAITLHSRTTAQQFGGHSDWSHIAELKKAVKIPVIGNGDVKTPEDAKKMLDETGCDGVMIGRGALGNPWIFSRTLKYLKEGIVLLPPPEEEVFSAIRHHIEGLVEFMGERSAVKEFRKHIGWYTKGLPHSSDFRRTAIHIDNLEDLLDECDAYFETLRSVEDDFFIKAFGGQEYEIGAQ